MDAMERPSNAGCVWLSTSNVFELQNSYHQFMNGFSNIFGDERGRNHEIRVALTRYQRTYPDGPTLTPVQGVLDKSGIRILDEGKELAFVTWQEFEETLNKTMLGGYDLCKSVSLKATDVTTLYSLREKNWPA
jgi:hypothetical protein